MGGADADPLYAVVLHGPPGTGKTTLIEALAATAGVPLVEVTPSDIVVRGTEAIEERARVVLRSLSLLTNAVILFDEFDAVLRPRSFGDAETSMFTFLTAGMLPKLKRLYDSAEDRHIAYALVTNFRKDVDDAAIRGGRFDQQIGIYPPDLLSRYGRLHQEVQAHLGRQLTQAERDRVARVVVNTAGGPMHVLGKPGWFTRPSAGKSPKQGTAFSFIIDPKAEPNIPKSDSDAWKDEFLDADERKTLRRIGGWDYHEGDLPAWARKLWDGDLQPLRWSAPPEPMGEGLGPRLPIRESAEAAIAMVVTAPPQPLNERRRKQRESKKPPIGGS